MFSPPFTKNSILFLVKLKKETQPKGWRQFLPDLRFALKSGYPCRKSDENYKNKRCETLGYKATQRRDFEVV